MDNLDKYSRRYEVTNEEMQMSHQSHTNILSGVIAGAAGVIAGVAILFFSSSAFADVGQMKNPVHQILAQ
jgi:hypothetical protein